VLTYNVAFLLSFALAGIGMYLLVRLLTQSRAAALVAGAYYAFCPFRLAQAQLSHIQMLATGWMPIALWALHEYFLSFGRTWLALFVAAFCLQVLSNSYVAYFMVVPIAVVMAFQAATIRAHIRRFSLDMAVAGVVIVAVLAPVAAQYYRVRTDYQQVRSTGEIETGGADVRAYFVATSGLWRRWLPLPQPIFAETEKELFPGIIAPLLAALALCAAAFRSRPFTRWAGAYGWIALAGFVLSLGPLVRVWGFVLTRHGPYDWLQHVVPGMGGMRTPSRFVLVAITGLSVLAGIGARLVLERIRPGVRTLAAVLLLVGVVADGWAVPIPIAHYSPRGRPEDRAVAEWLRDAPPGAVLHLPINNSAFQELHYQYATLLHGHPLVNGFSGWSTPLQELMRQPWMPIYDYPRFAATVRMFRSIGVRYIVVHSTDYNMIRLADGELTGTLAGLRGSGQIRSEKHLLDAFGFELEPWPDAVGAREPAVPIPRGEFSVSVSQQTERAAFLVDDDNDSRWMGTQDGSSWIAARFSQPHDVGRIELQLAARSLMDYPRELQVDTEDRQGHVRTLYRSSPYPEYLAGFLRDRVYPALWIDLPHNDTTVLWVREVATQYNWWSVHELRLWRRP
jgi:hypothetical protein